MRFWTSLQQEIVGGNQTSPPAAGMSVMQGPAAGKLSDPGSVQEGPGELCVLSHFCALLLKMNTKNSVIKGQLFQFCPVTFCGWIRVF